MSGRYRFRRRGTRRSFRSFARNNRTSIVRRARGNARAANNQSDTTDITINLMTKCKSGVTGYFYDDKVYQNGVVAINIYELLRKSDFFNSYAPMYDQFRITSIKVKVTPVAWETYNQFNLPNQYNSFITSVTNNSPHTANSTKDLPSADPLLPDDVIDSYAANGQNPSIEEGNEGSKVGDYQIKYTNNKEYIYPQALTVVTAWDRTGLDSSQLMQYKHDNDKMQITIGDAISTYSSAKSSQLVAGANFNCTRYLYPSSQQEKSLYHSTNDLKIQQSNDYTNDLNPYCLIKANPNTYDRVEYNKSYITNLYEDPNCPFKPTFLLGVLSVESFQLNPDKIGETGIQNENNMIYKIKPVTFNLEFDIGVTFRGLRKSQIV